MSNRSIVVLAAAAAVAMMAPMAATGQAPDGWTAPRTADGHPDLQGIWASDSATPLERPEELADKATLSDEEVATLQARAAELFNGETDAAFGESVFRAALADRQDYQSGDGVSEANPKGTGNYNQFWLIDRWFDNRTSLIVDPPDGRIPPRTAEAEQRAEEQREARAALRSADPKTLADELSRLGSGLRCGGGRVPMTGRGYNSNYQIFQSADYVAIQMEMMHDTRLIPIAGQSSHPSAPRSALGSSRGHWEGDTLVVETTDLARGASGSSLDVTLIERFTRVGPETMQYEYTLDDPSTWTQPWTARVYMRPAPGTGVIYEFACHEGNYAIAHTLTGARALEKEAGSQ